MNLLNTKYETGRKTETSYPSIFERREAASPYRRLPWRFSESYTDAAALYPPLSHGYPHEADLPLYHPGHLRGFFWRDEEWAGEDPNLEY